MPNTTTTRRRRGRAALPSTRHRDTDESSSPAHTPTSRRTRTPPTSLTDSEETDNSSSSTTIPPHNLDSSTRVASLPNTEYFQQPFQRLRIAPTTSDISPPITSTSNIASSYPIQQSNTRFNGYNYRHDQHHLLPLMLSRHYHHRYHQLYGNLYILLSISHI